MISLENIDDNVNYFEIYLCNNREKNIYNISLSKETFYKNVNRLKKTKFVYFSKSYKEYVYKDLYCQRYINSDDFKVFKKNTINFEKNNHLILISYNIENLGFLNFPSTMNLDNIVYVKKLIFRITNRIYLNFVITMNENKESYYSIYLNYNHNNNVDNHANEKKIREIMEQVSIS